MASAARLVLEDMVPELQNLEEAGYFSKEEIRHVIQKRQDFELRIRRKAAVKADFLRYITFEIDLEKLRQLRKKARKISGTNEKADHCIVRRTHNVYERMMRKFRGDISLWSRWIKYCQHTHSTRQMSKVLTRALQLHPTHAALWAFAASWEFDNNNNATAARALMQTGIRMCKSSPQLWHEYFRLEVLYANRLWARRQVLGLKLPTETAAEGDADVNAKAAEEVMKGGVAKIVYRNAIAAVVDSAEFRIKFLDVLRPVELPGRDELLAFIKQDIVSTFSDSAEAWHIRVEDARAAETGRFEQFKAAVGTYFQGLSVAPSPKLQNDFLEFLNNELAAFYQQQEQPATKLLAAAINLIIAGLDTLANASAELLLARSRIKARKGDVVGSFNDSLATCAADAQFGQGLRTALCASSAATALSIDLNNSAATDLDALVESNANMAGGLSELWLCVLRLFVAHDVPLKGLAHAFRKCYVENSIGTLNTHRWSDVAASFVRAAYTLGGRESAREMYVLMQGTQLDKSVVEHLL